MTSDADDFTLLASAPSIVKADGRANQLCSSLVRWADGKQLAIAPQKSSMTLFTSDTHQSRLHPQERIGASSHMVKLEVIQNKALRIVTGCHQQAAASHLRAETGVLTLRTHLELCSQPFYASALQSLHTSDLTVISPPAPSGATIQASYHRITELPSRPHITASYHRISP